MVTDVVLPLETPDFGRGAGDATLSSEVAAAGVNDGDWEALPNGAAAGAGTGEP